MKQVPVDLKQYEIDNEFSYLMPIFLVDDNICITGIGAEGEGDTWLAIFDINTLKLLDYEEE